MLREQPGRESGRAVVARRRLTYQQVAAIVRMEVGDRVQLGVTQGSGDRLRIDSAILSLAWLGP